MERFFNVCAVRRIGQEPPPEPVKEEYDPRSLYEVSERCTWLMRCLQHTYADATYRLRSLATTAACSA